jgi:galactokinase
MAHTPSEAFPWTTGVAPPCGLAGFASEEHVAAALRAGGLPEETARELAGTLRDAAASLLGAGAAPDAPARAYFVPGRIEVLGKHTDYCGGRSLLAATERGIVFLAVPSGSTRILVRDVIDSDEALFHLGPDVEPRIGHWSNYFRAVARRTARNFPAARRGALVAFGSTLPRASGMSSSSALIVGAFCALGSLNEVERLDEFRREICDVGSLAAYLATVENGASFGTLAGDTGVGTRGGSEDHTAILSCRAGELSVHAFAPPRPEGQIPLPDDLVLAVASSGVVAEKTGAAMEQYNRASRMARVAVEAWNRERGESAPHLAAVIAGSPEAEARMRELLSRARDAEFSAAELLGRLDHFCEESERIIPEAARCLRAGDLGGFGACVDRSQEMGARLLRNQVPETVHLAAAARRLGALAASAFGAGFGGSVWALVRRDGAGAFISAWRKDYGRAFPQRMEGAVFLATEASAAAFEVRPRRG